MKKLSNTKLTKWLLLPLLGILCLIGLLVSWIYFSESGLKWSLEQSKAYLPAELTYSNASGSLSDTVKFETITWQSSSSQLHSHQINLRCNWLDLIWKAFKCDKLELEQLTIALNDTEQTKADEESEPESESPFVNFTLPITKLIKPEVVNQIQIPIKLNVKQITVKRILLEQPNSNQQFKDFALSNLSISQHHKEKTFESPSQVEFKYSELQFVNNSHTMTSQLEISTASNLPYQFQMAVTGEKVNSKIQSQGQLLGQSTFNLVAEKPLLSSTEGNWSWKNKLFVNAKTNLQQQNLNNIAPPVLIKSTELVYTLDWPQLETTYQSQFDWLGISEIQLTGQVTSNNLINWQQASQMETRLYTNIGKQQWDAIKETSANTIAGDNPRSKISLSDISKEIELQLIQQKTDLSKSSHPVVPLDVELLATINESELSIHSKKANLANLKTKFDLAGTLTSGELKDYRISAEAQAANFEILGFRLKDINSQFILTQQQDKLFLNSHGNISGFSSAQAIAEKINWNIQLNELWQGKIGVGKLDLDGLNLNQIKLNIQGSQQAHTINGNFSIAENKPIELAINAKLLTKGDKVNHSELAWQINQLSAVTQLDLASSAASSQPLEFTAKNIYLSSAQQSIESLCIKNFGTACANATVKQGNWLANLQLENFKLRAVTRLPYVEILNGLSGELDGSLQASGTLSTLDKLMIDLSSPQLNFVREQYNVGLKNVNIVNSNPLGTSIVANWNELNASLETPQWLSQLSAAPGSATFNLNNNNQLEYSFFQESARWTLPASNIIDESQTETINISKKTLDFVSIGVTGTLNNQRIESNLELKLEHQDFITGSAKVDLPFTQNSKIESNLDIRITDLEWLKQWQSRIDQLSGSWTHQVKLSGNLTNPKLDGQGEIRVEQLVMEELGLDIKDSLISLVSDESTTKLNGVLRNNQGEVNLKGEVALLPEFDSHFEINGVQLTLIDSKEYKLVLSPQLKASFKKSHLQVEGNVDINEAKVTLSQLPNKTIRVSEDEVVVNKKTSQPEPFTYNIAIKVNAQKNVSFKGFGLKSDLIGKISTSAQTGKPLVINGQLVLENGEFEAYKQVLTIEQGQLLFLGTPDNPGIQFKASRKIEEIKVGVIADGSLANPSLRLFSEPTMPDEEVVALLLTGRSLKSLSQQEGNALANAAISLGVSEANRLAGKIADALGIKNINITTKTKADSTRVDIGTQINDRLSVGFGTNIDSSNQLNSGWIIEYRLSPSISFEAISGEEVSANITYKKQFEDKGQNTEKDKDKDKKD